MRQSWEFPLTKWRSAILSSTGAYVICRFPPPWIVEDHNDACLIVKDRNGHARKWLRSTFENVSVFLKAPQVRLEQAKCSFGIPRIHPRSPQTDYAALLLLYDAPPFGDELLGAAKIIFGIHLQNNAQAAKQAQDPYPPPAKNDSGGPGGVGSAGAL